MKIVKLKVADFPPIKLFEIENLGDFVVIAGANGSGKTRLKRAVIDSFRGVPQADLTIQSTRDKEEEKYFDGKEVLVKKGEASEVLNKYVQSRTGKGQYVGTVVQIDSNREITNIRYNAVDWFNPDPDDAAGSMSFFLSPFRDRWQSFIDYIYQKIASRSRQISEAVLDESNPKDLTREQIIGSHPDPLEKYKKLFREILPGKELVDVNPRSPEEFKYRDEAGAELPFNTLSSGEQEVIKILFDVARKEIRHSIVIVDEPELHLHPNLTFKLIESLRKIGDNTNQFIFLTHSADIISTYYSLGNVYFIDQDCGGANQAKRLGDLQEKHSGLLSKISGNLGVFAVGKKFLFVEGEESSADRLVYQKVSQNLGFDFTVVPLGSVENLNALRVVSGELSNSVFGIDFCMIRDRDGLTDSEVSTLEQNHKFRCLKKRHVENYFLDPVVLSKVAKQFYLDASLHDPVFLKTELDRLAKETMNLQILKSFRERLGIIGSISVSSIGSIESMPAADLISKFSQMVELEKNNLLSQVASFQSELGLIVAQLEADLTSGNWTKTFHGKQVFQLFCGQIFRQDKQRVKDAYVDLALGGGSGSLDDIKSILTHLHAA